MYPGPGYGPPPPPLPPLQPVSILRQVFNAAENDLEALKTIIEANNVPLTVLNGLGQSLAHIAAKSGNGDVMKYVLEKEPRLIHSKDDHHCSILHLAVIKGSLEAVKYLVEEKKAHINYMGGYYRDRTAFHAAVEFNHLPIVKYFVEDRNIDPNMPHPKQTIPPIFLTVRRKNWDVIRYLIEERNANLDMVNNKQENILFPIVREDFMGFMEYLLDEKKFALNVNWKNYYGETITHVAVAFGRIQMLEYLVDKKYADINIQKRTDGRTPLHYAAARDRYDICEFLITRGADPTLVDSYGHYAADKARDGRLIEYLDYATRSKQRPRRSVALPYSALKPMPLPLFESAQRQKSIGHQSQPVGFVAEAGAFPHGSTNVSYFQSFLFLAKSLITGGKKERLVPFASPTSMLRSRMSSVAMDTINGNANFSTV